MSVTEGRAPTVYDVKTLELKRLWLACGSERRRSRFEEEMLEVNAGLVRWSTARFHHRCKSYLQRRVTFEDLDQEARLQMVVAFRKWDPDGPESISWGPWVGIYLRKVGNKFWKASAGDELSFVSWQWERKILAEYDDGLSVEEIAAKFGLGVVTVSDVVLRPAFVSGDRPLSNEPDADAMWDLSVMQLADTPELHVDERLDVLLELPSFADYVRERFSEEHWQIWEQRVFHNGKLRSIGAPFGLSREGTRHRLMKINAVLQHPAAVLRWPTLVKLFWGSDGRVFRIHSD